MKKLLLSAFALAVALSASAFNFMPLKAKAHSGALKSAKEQITKAPKSGKLISSTPNKADVLVTPPSSATIETDWAIDGTYVVNDTTAYQNPNTISVAFDGNDVYIQGISLFSPEAWIKGTINGTTATFTTGQFLGTTTLQSGTTYSLYACGYNGSALSDMIFAYDKDKKTFTLQNYYLENTSTTTLGFFFYSYDLVVYKNLDVPAPTNVTVESSATTANVSWTENGEATSWNLRYRVCTEPENLLWDFEDTDQLEGWGIIDADGDSIYWQYINQYTNPHSGNANLTSASYNGTALTPDNWLISPAVPMGGKVSFWAAGQDANYAAEVFKVYVYAGEDWTSVDDFIALSDDITATGEYVQHTFDLSAYQGTGYIAIRHYNCTDMFRLNIDDFAVEVPGGSWPGEWTTVENVTTNPYMIEGLTPETHYQVQVQAVNDILSDWTGTVAFTTLAPDVYILGEVGENTWAPNVGLKMQYSEENQNYTANVTFDGRGQDGENYFSFTTKLADNADDWNGIAAYRFGAVSDGDFWVTDDMLGVDLSLTKENYQAFRIPAGEYDLTLDYANMKLKIEKVASTVKLGDVNGDGDVNVNDVTVLINYILGKNPTPFIEANANVNGDEGINVNDVTALINMILN